MICTGHYIKAHLYNLGKSFKSYILSMAVGISYTYHSHIVIGTVNIKLKGTLICRNACIAVWHKDWLNTIFITR